MSTQPQGHSATSSTGVTEIVTHEEKEHHRIEEVKATFSAEEKKQREHHKKEKLSIDAEERAKAMGELRAFEATELPKIIEKGEQSLVASVEAIDATSKKMYPVVLKTLIDAVVAGAIAA